MNTKSNKSKPTHLYASLSIAIVLFLLGLFFIIFIHSQNLATLLKEKVNIVVELSDEADQKNIAGKLKKNTHVIPTSVKYLPKDEGLKLMVGEEGLPLGEENPLSDLLVFNVKATSYDEENLSKLKEVIAAEDGVSNVYFENMAIENIKTNINRVASVIFGLGLLFIFMAVVIIRNTINLSMYADRDEIITLERIGAKWSFIKLPYIKSSVLIGVKGFLIAVVSLAIIFVAVSINFPALWEVLNLFYILLSFILLFIVAVTIPALVSNSAANTYMTEK